MSSFSSRDRRGRRTYRLPAGLGCLVALVALPLAILAALVTVGRALLGRSRTRTGTSAPRARGGGDPADVAVCEFVRKMSLDETFDAEDAAMAGLPIDRDVTVEGLIEAGTQRGWIERRGERWAVTARGRLEAPRHLEQRGL